MWSSVSPNGRVEEIITWWSNLHDRPARVTFEEVKSGVIGVNKHRAEELSKECEYYNTKEGNWLRDALKELGFKRTLFEDGWFYVPPAKFALLRVLKAPTKEDVVQAQKVLAKASKRTFTYFIQAVNGGPIKIGKTDDIGARLSSLQTGNPFRLRVLLLLPEDEVAEREMHDAFAGHRIEGGEWFHPEKDLLDFIEQQILRVCGL